MGLRTKVSFIYALMIALTMAVTYFGIDFVVKDTFGSYLEKRIKAEQQDIIKGLPEAFDVQTGWDDTKLSGIMTAASSKGMSMTVFDYDGNFVSGTVGSGSGMMGMRRGGMMGMRANPYLTTERLDISAAGRKVGYADITYQNIFLTDADTEFLAKFNRFLIFSGIALASLAIVMGILFADSINKPIIRVLKMAGALASGDFEERIEERSDTKEIYHLYEGMNSLAEEMGRQDKLRKRLAGDIAHELKTPITIARANLEAMSDGVMPITPEAIAASASELDRLSEMAQMLEGITRMESGMDALELGPCNLQELVRSSVDASRALFDAKEISLSFESSGSSAETMLDCGRMRRVLDNLMMNALKYTDSGGRVSVRCEGGYGEAVIEVSDNGIGIDEKDLPFIFERLYRTDESRNRGTGGMGIGLSLAKSIVEAHGGTLGVSSVSGKGSTFKITLPTAH